MFRVRINDTEFDCTRTEQRSGCTYYDTYTLTDGRTFSRYRDHAQRDAVEGAPVGYLESGAKVYAVSGFTPSGGLETLAMKRKLAEDGHPRGAISENDLLIAGLEVFGASFFRR